MPRGGLFVVWQAKQIDYIMMHARREMNVTQRYFKLRGRGERFTYLTFCYTCKVQETVNYAKHAVAFVIAHLGHNTDVRVLDRDRTEQEIRNASYADKRRNVPP